VSGIVGIYYRNGHSVEPHCLEQMLSTLTHRGPDGSRHWQQGCIGFGHCMLWTTSESLHEALPYQHPASGLVITADARIDNREELLELLALDNNAAQPLADSELILAAYGKWGQDCPSRLLGDYAFAIWDPQHQTLFCARDHFGVKPFYYYRSDQCFIFASEIKALLSFPEMPCQLNELRIADYFLQPMLEDKFATVYNGIFRLPPAHSVHVSTRADFKPYCYWSLDCTATIAMPTDEDYAARFRDIFFEAVRCRLRTAFPLGSHLSGGLDSSTVTCVAHQILQQSQSPLPLHTFSNIFDNVPSCDEREYFNLVLEQGSYISHLIPADRLGPLSEWQDFFLHFDEPFLGPSHFLVHGLNRSTQEADVRVCLDGFDGDTVVSHGAFYFAELARLGNWEQFLAEAKAISEHFDTSPGLLLLSYAMPYLSELAQRHQWLTFAKRANEISQAFTISRRKLWIQYGFKPLLPRWVLGIYKSIKYRSASLCRNQGREQPTQALNPAFARRPNIKKFCKRRELDRSMPRSVREDQCQNLTSGAFTHVLELSDQCAAAFSIEVRHPFMDKRLVEFCLALPPDQKLKLGWSRIVMRQAMEGILPRQIQWRGGKASMEENFNQGLIVTDKAIVENALFSDSNHAKDFLNLEFLQRSFQALQSDPSGQKTEIIEIWKGATLSLWLQQRRRNGNLS
jgi:asparagine synthase (glutamine-hydrolysing)